ncbi:MAG: hypothetical protein Q9190_001588 [Brigantiaea leucoxantha]
MLHSDPTHVPFDAPFQPTKSQWLFTDAEMMQTPSILDGMPPEKERENRGKAINFIIQVGIMLKLPQITVATASVLLHRFFMRYSMVQTPNRVSYHYYSMAATSLFLSTKVEETGRKMKELVIACVRVAQKDHYKRVDEQDKEYWRWRDIILHNEDVLLEAVCFDLALEPPYKALFHFLKRFKKEEDKKLRNAAWAFINDSYLTTLCLRFPSRTIAASALYAAAKHCHVLIPDDRQGRPWWNTVSVDIKSIKQACNRLAEIYEHVPPKDGREANIHERTPEDGDDSSWKTRAITQPARGDSEEEFLQPIESESLGTESMRRDNEFEGDRISDSGQRITANGGGNLSSNHEITKGRSENDIDVVQRAKRRKIGHDQSQPRLNDDHSAKSPSASAGEMDSSAQYVSEEGEVEA